MIPPTHTHIHTHKHPLGNMFNPPPLGNKFCKIFFKESQNLSGNSFLFLLDHSLNIILGVESSSHIGCSFTFSTNPVSTWCICKTHTLKMKPLYIQSTLSQESITSWLWTSTWRQRTDFGAHILSSLTWSSSRDYTWKSLGILAPFHCSHKMVWGRNCTEAIKDVTYMYGARVQ